MSTTKAVKKDKHSLVGRRDQVRICVPSRDTEKKKRYHRFRDPPWGFWGSCHILGIAVLGTNTWKDESQQLV